MLHQLSYAYSQTRFGGDRRETLNALGRFSGWLFRDSFRKGNQHLVNASEAIREAFVFPAQDVRQAHLGYQLAWLRTNGDREARMRAASVAEAFPVSPTMDPTHERDALADLVESYQRRRREERTTGKQRSAIAAVLREELERRWRLTDEAYNLLRLGERTQNAGVGQLVKDSMKEFWGQHQRIELRVGDPSLGPAFIAHPETDFHGSAAASRYLIHSAADEAYVGELIHDDAELFDEALEDGHALRGTVASVWDVGEGKTTRPMWRVSVGTEGQSRIREGGRLVPYGSPRHEVTVVSIEQVQGARLLELEWTSRKTMQLSSGPALRPVAPEWTNEIVAFVASDAASLTRRRSARVWSAKDGPGAWLTHGRPPPPAEGDDVDDEPDLVVDDISQIEGPIREP